MGADSSGAAGSYFVEGGVGVFPCNISSNGKILASLS